MRKVKPILLFLFSFYNLIMFSQEKKFEIGYNISGWYKHEKGPIPDISKTYYLNNNLKLGYRFKPYLSFGLSTNFCYQSDHSKTPLRYMPDRTYYDIGISKNYEIGTGPYLKISIGNNFQFFTTLEYNYFNGKDTLIIYDEYHLKYQSARSNYRKQIIASEIGLEKRILRNLKIGLYIREQYTFVYTILPENPNISSNPSLFTLIGIGLSYNFNLKN